MEKAKAVIIDDELSGRITIKNLLQEHCPEIEVVGEAASVVEGQLAIETYQPELVFLDIQLRPGTGFDLLDKVDHSQFDVIFCTAFDQFALKAFEFSALHYLTKPLDVLRLKEAIQRFISKSDTIQDEVRLEALRENMKAQSFKKIAIPEADGFKLLMIEDILRCEADGSYTHFHLKQGKQHTASQRLGHYEELLDNRAFIRVHHSHLVNLNHVEKYTKGRGGTVSMSDGTEVPVSERLKKDLIERLKGN